MNTVIIARYHNDSMLRKLDYLAAQPSLKLTHISPNQWQDELQQMDQSAPSTNKKSYQHLAFPMIGRPNDPHRALYRSFTFGLPRSRPHIIHAEEEPDSLTALQITVARQIYAPRAKLVWHTWQNVNRPKPWYVNAIMQLTLRASDAVLCANQEAVDVLRANGYTKRTEVITPIGVDTQLFYPAARPDILSKPFTIAYFGRMLPEKGIDTLIHALALIHRNIDPTARLILMGNGPERPALEAQIRNEDLLQQARFIDPGPLEKVACEMQQVDVLVLPSRTTPVWKEQFGRVLVEAMACKVAVIGSTSGAIPEVIGDAGLLFPEGNAEVLANRVKQLIEAPAFRRELAERGYQRVTSLYTQERVAAQTARIYQSLLPFESETHR